MFGFFKKIKVEIPDGKGRTKIIKVSQKQWDLWEKEGHVTSLGVSVRVHVIDPFSGYYRTEYLLGRDIDEESYKKFKDANEDIYISIHYENGKPHSSLLKKELWESVKKALNY